MSKLKDLGVDDNTIVIFEATSAVIGVSTGRAARKGRPFFSHVLFTFCRMIRSLALSPRRRVIRLELSLPETGLAMSNVVTLLQIDHRNMAAGRAPAAWHAYP
jgi:hypothetical protein